MKIRVLLALVAVVLLTLVSLRDLSTQPSFNGATAGCSGGGCHSLSNGIVSVTATNLSVTVTMSGNTGKVAGELVDGAGTVVASNNSTSTNPFTLTAPGPGLYRVNAGYKSPNLRWDSSLVQISAATAVRLETPLVFSLESNYPNPFNPTTTIAFTLPEPETVKLAVFDLQGNAVATLVNGRTEPGRHTAVFDGTGLPSGVYFYRLEAGNSTETRQLVLLK
jgi:hypothetical protein